MGIGRVKKAFTEAVTFELDLERCLGFHLAVWCKYRLTCASGPTLALCALYSSQKCSGW